MLISEEKLEIRNNILSLDQRVDEMHMAFQKYTKGDSRRMPEWEKLERDLVGFSRKKFFDFELSQQLDKNFIAASTNRKSKLLHTLALHPVNLPHLSLGKGGYSNTPLKK
jgi:hypothetical protein